MLIALDAMGGDYAPGPIVAGAVQAVATDPELGVVLVGDQAKVEPLLPGEDAAHDAVLEQVLRLGVDVGADVEHDDRAALRGHDGGDARPADVLEEQLEQQAAGDHGAGVAGADDTVGLALGQELPAAAEDVGRRAAIIRPAKATRDQ